MESMDQWTKEEGLTCTTRLVQPCISCSVRCNTRYLCSLLHCGILTSMTPKQRHSKPLDLGSESIAYVPMSECSATSINEHQDAIGDTVDMVGQALDSQEPGALAGRQGGKNEQ